MKLKTPASGNVYTRILEDIGNGTFASGTRLKVQELADRYGTSIIPVREALRLLQGEGIVTIAPNKGATVSELNAEMILEIFEILQLMEPYFVKAFVNSCTEADILQLEGVQAELQKTAVTDKAAFTALDKQFHEIIARRHYNQRAYDIWELQRRLLNALALPVPISTARHQAILKEHEALIDAFRKSDETAALQWIERHVQGAGDQMYMQLKKVER